MGLDLIGYKIRSSIINIVPYGKLTAPPRRSEKPLASDQTPKEYLHYGATIGALGTGVFLQTPAGGGTLVTFRSKITYQQCRTYGTDHRAFKWIPEAVASYAEVQSDVCAARGEECVRACAAKGCLCNHPTNSCVDATGNAPGSPRGGERSGPGDETEEQEQKRRQEEAEARRRRRKRTPALVGAKS